MDMTRRAFLFGRQCSANQSGATGIEYGMIGALIGVASIASLKSLRFSLKENMRCTGRVLKSKKIGKKCKKAGF